MEKLFTEQTSALAQNRQQLDAAIDFAREGDMFVVSKPDRLARSVPHLLAIVRRLQAKRVGLIVLSMGGQRVDTSSPTGKLMLTMLAAVAEFERDLMLERQAEGITKAKAAGKYKGRVPTARKHADEVLRLKSDGLRPYLIARRVGISRASVYRILGSAGAPPPVIA